MRKHLFTGLILMLAMSSIILAEHNFSYSDPQSKQTRKNGSGIRILSATFGDQLAHKTCTPDLSICKGLALCKFTVGDLCPVDSQVKNLEVVWDCGDGTDKKAKAAAKDTEIRLECK